MLLTGKILSLYSSFIFPVSQAAYMGGSVNSNLCHVCNLGRRKRKEKRKKDGKKKNEILHKLLVTEPIICRQVFIRLTMSLD